MNFLPTIDRNAMPALPVEDRRPPSFWEGVGAGFTSEGLRANWNFQRQRTERQVRRDLAQQAREHFSDDELLEILRPGGGDADLDQMMQWDWAANAVLTLAEKRGIEIDASDEAIAAESQRRQQEEYRAAEDALNLMPSQNQRMIADLLGSTAAFMTDARTLPFIVLGGGSGTVLRVAGREAAIAVSAESVLMRERFRQAELLDIEDPNVLLQYAFAAAAGAVFGTMVEGGRRGLQYMNDLNRPAERAPGGMSPQEWSTVQEAAQTALERGADPERAALSQIEAIQRQRTTRQRMMGTTAIPEEAAPAPRLRLPDQDEPTPRAEGETDGLQEIQQGEGRPQEVADPLDEPEYRPATPEEVRETQQALREARRDTPGGMRPVASMMARSRTPIPGGETMPINPDGPLGRELLASDVRPGGRGVPVGLFDRRHGMLDADNLVRSEWEEMFPGITKATGTDFSATYLDRQGFIDYLVREITQGSDLPGPRVIADLEARLSEMTDRGIPVQRVVDPLDIDDFIVPPPDFDGQRMTPDMIAVGARRHLERIGQWDNLTPAERERIIRDLQEHGGSAEDLAMREFEKGVDFAEIPAERAQALERSAPDGREFEPFFNDEFPAPTSRAGAEPVGEGPGGAGRGGQDPSPESIGRASDAGDGVPATERTPEGEQFLIDGVAPITQGDRLAQRQAARMGGDPRGADSEIGGLFDPHAKTRTDLFDDPTSPQAQRALDQVEADLRRQADAEDMTVDMGDGLGPRSASSVLDEFAADREFLDILDICGRPRA